MPSFQDSAFIFFLALLLFGPKKLPELARYVGKLMAEFRRASYEFRSQMEEEFRVAEQAEQQKKIAAIEAAAPVPPVPAEPQPPSQPSLDPVIAPAADSVTEVVASSTLDQPAPEAVPPADPAPTPLPIATSGDLHLMPPATGLPVARKSSSNPQPAAATEAPGHSLSSLFDSIPHTPEPAAPEPETTTHA